jgi:hypothetical protein
VLPKRQEDQVRIKADNQTAHRSTKSSDSNDFGASAAARDAASDRHSDDSDIGAGAALNLSVGRRSPHYW